MLNEEILEKLLQKVTNSLKKGNRKPFSQSVKQIKQNPKVKDVSKTSLNPTINLRRPLVLICQTQSMTE